jgi:hypothetical protein
MSCNILDFKLNAISLEIQDVNVRINVQDIFGSIVSNAEVLISYPGNSETGTTDEDGDYYGVVVPNVICSLTITKDCFDTYIGKFILLSDIDINDPESNFPMIVVDQSSQRIENAEVTVTSSIVETGYTDANGFLAIKNNNAEASILTIEKSGFQMYSANIPLFLKLYSELTGFHAVPVITLNSI